MFSRWIVTNITSASVTTFLAFLAGIISWSVYCTYARRIPCNCVELDKITGIILSGIWKCLYFLSLLIWFSYIYCFRGADFSVLED
jgi:drug/metabolite transporter (DMT)-like permease